MRGLRGLCGLPGQNRIQLVHHRLECRAVTVARARQIDPNIGDQMSRMRAQHHHTVGHLHGLFNVVRNHQHRFDAALFTRPQLEHFLTKILGSQYIQRGERLIHKQCIRLQHQCARDAHALPHAAGQFLGICRFKAIQTNHVNGIQRQFGALRLRHAACLETQLHIVIRARCRDSARSKSRRDT